MRRLKGENEKMKREILDSRRKVAATIVGAFPGGRECAATYLGLDLKRFDNQLYQSAGHQPLSDEQLQKLEAVAGTTYLPDYLCSLYGGVYVVMPEVGELDNVELYRMALDADVKEGRVDQVIAKALKSGDINEEELGQIIAAHRQHLAARHAEVNAVIALHRKPQP